MPNFGSYSPWQDASENAFRPAGNSLNQLALEIAKARYNRNNRAAELGLQLEKLQQNELMNQAHSRLYAAQTGQAGANTKLADTRSAHQQAVDDAARELQKSVVAHDYPNPLQNGPTIADQAQMLSARQHGSAALVAGLHGTPQEAFQVHNIPANNIAMDPMSGMTVGTGALELSPGSMYQAPGQAPVTNERPYFAPAGSTPMGANGQPKGPQTGFKPGAAGSRSSATDAVVLRSYLENHPEVMDDPSSPFAKAAQAALTNSQPQQAVSPSPSAQRPPHTPDEEALLQKSNATIQKMIGNGWDPAAATNAVQATLKQMNPAFDPK